MTTTADNNLRVRNLGLQVYESIYDAMRRFTLEREPSTPDEIWILQHYPVFTQGQAGKPEHILDAHDIPVIQTDRGGQVTYHGPGQLVVYVLVDLRRRGLGARQLVDVIEQSMLQVLDSFGVSGHLKDRAPGVYVEGSKIAALGLRVKRGCSYHGLSFNIDMDLTPFSFINPCGYEGLQATQLQDCLDGLSTDLLKHAGDRLIEALQVNLLQ